MDCGEAAIEVEVVLVELVEVKVGPVVLVELVELEELLLELDDGDEEANRR
jgi:hypothetical protein